jgi:outer membrane receptor protein involved in Fe transport
VLAPILFAAPGGIAFAQTAAQTPASGKVAEVTEIVVTANRSEQAVSKAPISVAAYSQIQMDKFGVKQLDDLARLTPGLNLIRADRGVANLSIRGISSTAGAATTGIYIDDTPIQIRGTNGAGPAFPTIFDLNRVEVLRGPQGTLFGSGSEGGTVRFIQTEPSLTQYSSYTRTEAASIQSGSPSYEFGTAIGGPLVEDKLGFRVSAFFRHDGGYIDRVTGNQTVVSPTGMLPGQSIAFARTGDPHPDANWTNTTVIRAALAWQATTDLKITPSFFYQDTYMNDNSQYLPSASTPGNFAFPVYSAGPADSRLTAFDAPDLNSGKDRFYLPALKIQWDLPAVLVTSDTSYFIRDAQNWYDSTAGYTRTFGGYNVPKPGDKASYDFTPTQRNLTEEIRFQSRDQSARLTWVVGGFFSQMKQKNQLAIGANMFSTLSPINGSTSTAPFGAAYSAFTNYYGIPMLPNSGTYYSRVVSTDDQIAAFGQADFHITSKLTFTAGVRVANNKLNYNVFYSGPENVLNAPEGRACVPSSKPCIPVAVGQYAPGQGPFATLYNQTQLNQSETAVTPKFNLAFQATDGNLFYATIAKGFRPGSAQVQLPSDCSATLISLGYTDASGKASTPSTYKSDSVWSYEVGSKNKLFDNKVNVDASAYIIKWSDIQTSITVPVCGYAFITNLNNATSTGFDASVRVAVTDSLQIGTAVAYNNATFDQSAKNFSGGVIFSKGSSIPTSGSPWTVSLSADYTPPRIGRLDPYVRVDYTYQSKWTPNGQTDRLSVSYDPYQPLRPATTLVNARAGARIRDLDVSIFVDNLLNASPDLALSHARNSPLWTDSTFRPRTVGITVSHLR